MTPFSCVLIGEESLLIACAEALLDRGHAVAAVVTADPAIADWAAARAVPVLARSEDLTARFDTGGFDWILSIANLRLIPDAVLALPARGAVNFHDGPLPRYAGLNAPAWALMAGETDYAVSWHLIAPGIDTGDILVQSPVAITEDDTAFSLNAKCYAAALDGFGALMRELETGLPGRRPQDLSARSYCARDDRPAAAGWIDPTRPAREVLRLVRGLDFGGYWNPLCRAKIRLGEGWAIIGAARIPETAPAGPAAPGTVLETAADRLVIATGDGVLELSRFSDLTGAALAIADHLSPGDRLAAPDRAGAAALEAATRRVLPAEAHWRRALRAMRPLPLALAAPAAPDHSAHSARWQALPIALPDGLDPTAQRGAALAWALGCAGESAGDLAVQSAAAAETAAAAQGLITGWAPFACRAEETAEAAAARLAKTLARLDAQGGFARDLIARDPEIAWPGMPAIGLSPDGAGPVPGSAVTLELGRAGAVLHVDAARIDAATADLLARRLDTALAALAEPSARARPLARIPVLPPSERRQMLVGWNRTARDHDRGQTVHGAFEAQVARSPDAPALIHEDRTLSYRELNRRANILAARLRAMGVAPGRPVGLLSRRRPELVIGALAILKAGGAYVPLDPAYPDDRLAHYLRDSDAAVVLAEPGLTARLPDDCAAQVLALEETEAGQGDDPGNPGGGAGAADPAYLIYTSGSTGAPKGVMVEHRNVINFFAGMDDRIPHQPGDCWAAVTSLNFDISVLELFWTLARGFKVVLIGDENRAAVSAGPLAAAARPIAFNLMYWGNDDGPGPKKYELLLEGAKFADAHGFNAVWTPERHFHAFGGPYPNPAVTGAAVAAVTRHLSVRAGSVVAPLHHPARIAEEWAVIDNLTGGRAALAIASGWQPDDFILRPENTPPANKKAMLDTIETLRRLWRGEAVEFPRADGSLHAVVTQPRPVSPELPIWVTTAGNPETWKEAGRIGANVLTHLLGQSIEEVAGKIALYHAALREAGHDPADFTVTLMLHSYLAPSREEAAAVARGPMKDYLRAAAGLIKQYAWAFPAFKKPQGVTTPFEMDLGMLSEEELEAILDFAFDRYFHESGLFGTIEDGLERVEQLRRIGVDEIACLIDYGIAPEQVLEGLKPLAELLARANAPEPTAPTDHSLAAQILRHGVTHLQCTPSMARLIAMNEEARQALGRVRHLLLGGEALPGDLVADLRACTDAAIFNMYGPTETTIWSTCDAVAATPSGTASIGTPIANTAVYVLGPDDQPVPIGVAGELCIGGEGVTRGYWGRPEMTAERFRPDPFAAEAGLEATAAPRLYRTGDLVRWRPDGRLEFLGRSDHQVKIRGQRIELGEIEAALAAQPGIKAAVVVAREMAPGDLRLVGYVTRTEAGAGPADAEALRAALARHLPEAMLPARIVTLDTFPLTPNRKIDRKALPDPTPRPAPLSVPAAAPATAAAPPSAPATAAAASAPAAAAAGPGPALAPGQAEPAIARIWARILGVETVRGSDNFFDLGGHSLLAVQAHREIRQQLGLAALTITDIFRFPTLAALAAHAEGLIAPAAAAAPSAPATATADPGAPSATVAPGPDRAETMSRRRAMRAGRGAGRDARRHAGQAGGE